MSLDQIWQPFAPSQKTLIIRAHPFIDPAWPILYNVFGECCDLTRLNKLTLADNVVELMVDNIQRLPATSQAALQVAACLGIRFDPELLYRIIILMV